MARAGAHKGSPGDDDLPAGAHGARGPWAHERTAIGSGGRLRGKAWLTWNCR